MITWKGQLVKPCMWFAAVMQSDECCRPGLYITLYAIQAHVACIVVMELFSYETCFAPSLSGVFISINGASSYTSKTQKSAFPLQTLLSFQMETVCWCHISFPQWSWPWGVASTSLHHWEDGTVKRRSHDLWPCSMDCVWLLFTPELSYVDTKWLSHFGRQWEKQERGSVLSGQHRNSATQSDNTEKYIQIRQTASSLALHISSPPPHPYFQTEKWQVWIC